MWIQNILKSLTSSSARRRPARRPSSARLSLEALEDRRVPSYSVIDLGTLGGTISHAGDINASGQVVGWSTLSSGRERAFLWQNGMMIDLGTLGGTYSTANGINDVGQIVGSAGTADGTGHAFLLTPEDTDGNGTPDRWFRDSDGDGDNDLMMDLGPAREAYDVNNSGQVVGDLRPGGYDAHAFRWQNGVTTDLGTLGGPTSSAAAINNAGQVTGSSDTATGGRSAFLWQAGVMRDIGASIGASDINQSGQVAGGDGWLGYASLWTPTTPNGTDGSFQSLGALPPDYFGWFESVSTYSGAGGVNDLGTVVGSSYTTHSYADEFGGYYFETARGFLWAGGVMEELPELQNATAINNAGQIVGNGPYDSTGNTSPYRAFLLTPDSLAVPQASSFVVSGFPSPTTAGTAGSFTVTAKNADGTTASGYTGTVHFTSSDPLAILPSNYTFVASDNGVHTFSGTLKTAGSQTVTATDTVTSSITGNSAVTVSPAAASTMTVTGFPSPTTAGVAGSFTVKLKDPYGNIASGYTGTVHFTSSDGKASLPANYIFTAADAGVHTFSATLKTAGTQSITAKDTTTASLTGTDGGVTVNPAAASRFLISAPSSVTAGVPFSLTVTVQDAYGNVVTGYTGTIHFKSTDSTASLPANYSFTAADKGVHTFSGLILRKKGNQTITITDMLNSSLTATDPLNVG